MASPRPGTRPPRTPLPGPPPSGARLGYLELSSAKWDPSPVPLTLQTAKHDSPPGRGNSVSLMRRRRRRLLLLLLLAGPLRRRGEPRAEAEGGGDAGRLCKVWEEDEASGRPGSVRGPAGLRGACGELGLGAAPRPGPARADESAAASSPSFAAAAAGAADREAGGRPGGRALAALTAPSEDEVRARAAPESQTQKPPARSRLQNPLWGGRRTWRGRGFPALRSQPRAGTDFGGRGPPPGPTAPPAAAAAASRSASAQPPRPARASRSAPGFAGPRPWSPGRAARAEGPPRAPHSPAARQARGRPLGGPRAPAPAPAPASARRGHLPSSSEAAAGTVASQPATWKGRTPEKNFGSGSWRVLGGPVDTHVPRLRVRGLDTCLWNCLNF